MAIMMGITLLLSNLRMVRVLLSLTILVVDVRIRDRTFPFDCSWRRGRRSGSGRGLGFLGLPSSVDDSSSTAVYIIKMNVNVDDVSLLR